MYLSYMAFHSFTAKNNCKPGQQENYQSWERGIMPSHWKSTPNFLLPPSTYETLGKSPDLSTLFHIPVPSSCCSFYLECLLWHLQDWILIKCCSVKFSLIRLTKSASFLLVSPVYIVHTSIISFITWHYYCTFIILFNFSLSCYFIAIVWYQVICY